MDATGTKVGLDQQAREARSLFRTKCLYERVGRFLALHPNSTRRQTYRGARCGSDTGHRALVELERMGRVRKAFVKRLAEDNKKRRMAVWRNITGSRRSLDWWDLSRLGMPGATVHI